MNKKSVGLKIVLWSEVIIAARALLFYIPVMINRYLEGGALASSLDDRFMIVVILTALLYFVIGIMSIAGFKAWKIIHYLAVVLILVLTVGSLKIPEPWPIAVGFYYFIPLVFSVVVTALAGALKGPGHAA